MEGVSVVQTFDRERPALRYRKFRAAYIKRFRREPGFPGVNTHEAVSVVPAALRNHEGGPAHETSLFGAAKRFYL